MIKKRFQSTFRIIILLIFIVISAFSVTPIHVNAESYFKMQGDILIKYTGSQSTVTIPDGVTQIAARAFENNNKMKKVVVPESVKYIDCYAFCSCEKLTEITLPSKMNYIAAYAFTGCEALKQIKIPEGIEQISMSTFHHCTSLTKVTLPKSLKSIQDEAFNNCKKLKQIDLPEGLKEIGYNAFADSGIRNPKLPSTLTFLGDLSIYQGMKKVTLPSILKKIPLQAFCENEVLEEIIIPEGVEEIGDSAFSECFNLKKVVLPSTIKAMEDDAFSRCPNIETIACDKAPADFSVFSYSFYDTKLPSNDQGMSIIGNVLIRFIDPDTDDKSGTLTIPEDVKEIGDSAFKDVYLPNTTFIIPAGVKTIGMEAFENATFKNIIFKGRITDLEYEAAKGLKLTDVSSKNGFFILNDILISYTGKAKTVTIPDGVRIIASEAFIGNTSLTTVTIPDDVECIGSSAFCDCTKLKTVINGKNIKIIKDGAFARCTSLTKITLSKYIEELPYSCFGGDKSLKNITLPDRLKIIDQYCFCESGLTEITIPKGMKLIDDLSFQECKSLKKVKILGVENLGSAFVVCPSLSEVTLPNSGIKNISRYCFYQSPWESKMKGPMLVTNGIFLAYTGTGKSVTIPDNVYIIAGSAFPENQTVTSITVPENVTTISEFAFSFCYYSSIRCLKNSAAYLTAIKDETSVYCTGTAKINKTAMTLKSGESTQLKVMGNSTLEWISSNKNVAVVKKSGKVTAVKKGTARI